MARFLALRRLGARVRGCFLVLLLLFVPLAAAAPQDLTLRATATDAGYTFVNFEGLNPRIGVEPGQKVFVALYNDGSKAANFQVGAPINVSTPCCIPPGDSDSLEFVVPEGLTGEVAYFSSAEPTLLRGVLVVAEGVPGIRIEAPAMGANVGQTVTMRVVVTNFELDPYPYSEENQLGRGHVRYLLDGNVTGGPTNRTQNTFVVNEVGSHLLRAELVNYDGTVLSPAVSASIIVERVRDAMPDFGAEPETQQPTNDTPLPIALAVASAIIASAFRRRR